MAYKITIPVEMDVEIDAANLDLAEQKADNAVAWFLSKLTPYKISTPEFGAFTLTLQPDRPALDAVTPADVDIAEPFEGSCLVPADHPAYRKADMAIIADRSVDLTGEFLPDAA